MTDPAELGWTTGPADWARFERGARRYYRELARRRVGPPWPDRVVRVGSPLVGALAAQIAEELRTTWLLDPSRWPDRRVRAWVRWKIFWRLRGGRAHRAVRVAVFDAVVQAATGQAYPRRTPRDPVRFEPSTDRRRGRGAWFAPLPLGAVGLAMAWCASIAAGLAALLGVLASAGTDVLTPWGFWPGIGAVVGVAFAFVWAAREPPRTPLRAMPADMWIGLPLVGAVVGAVPGALLGLIAAGGERLLTAAVFWPAFGAVVGAAVGIAWYAHGTRRLLFPSDTAARALVGQPFDLRRGAIGEAIRQATLDAHRTQDGLLLGAGELWLEGVDQPTRQPRWESDTWRTDRDDPIRQTADRTDWYWWPRDTYVIVSARPTSLEFAALDPPVLHCDDGPAATWPDGWRLYFLRGVRVNRQIVESPDTLRPRQIAREPNIEVRRIMIERFGAERFVRGLGAEPVQRDEFGTLWRVRRRRREPLQYVQVVNSTPNPDGSYSDYWLQVPPDVRTAHEAVAWTFGLTSDEYRPAVET